MNRRTLFAGIAGGAVVLAVVAGGGVAVAVVMGQNPPDDSGPTAVATSTPSGPVALSDPAPTATPSASTDTASPQIGQMPLVDRMRARQPGDVLLTRTALATWAADHPRADQQITSADVAIGVAEQAYETKCMWDLGYYWDPRVDPAHLREAIAGGLRGIPEPVLLAYYGTNLHDAGVEYVWQNAGCNGAAIHFAGQDGNS